jgi:hypothetical protein
VLREDVLGEMLLAMVVTHPADREAVDTTDPLAMATMTFTNECAAGWGGDRVVLVGKDDARVLRLVTEWDTERDAAEFYGGMLHVMPALRAAASELNTERKHKAGAALEYGDEPDTVAITCWYGVDRREVKKVLPALGYDAD